MTDQSTDTPQAKREDDTIALLQEVPHVDVRSVITGRIQVRTHVETIADIAHATLKGETVEVRRVTRNVPITGLLPEVRTEGDVTIVPVFEEVLVVETRLMLKEELHIRRQATSDAVSIPVTLRQQTVTIDRLTADGHPIATPS